MENNVNRIIDGLRFRTFDKVYKNVKAEIPTITKKELRKIIINRDEYINVTPCPSVSGQGVTLILALFITQTSAIFTISFLRCLSPST